MTTKTEPQQRLSAPFGWRTVTPRVMGAALNPVNSLVAFPVIGLGYGGKVMHRLIPVIEPQP